MFQVQKGGLMSKHYMSLFINEQACIKALLELHNGGRDIDCDPMYFKGNFYKDGVNVPKYIFDIFPRTEHCPQGNAEALPLSGGSIDSIILDPLFIFGIHGKAAGYYANRTMGTLKDFAELERHYKAIIAEARRVLKPKGICIFKCQDYPDSKTTMTHCLVFEWATAAGLYAKDLAILNIPQAKIYNGNTTQRHLRKTHTYFWVFEKKRSAA
jgi:hypothetical protein